jgi:metal-responsive CopG/Arc/MetJ family transcriptional regulator
MKTVVSIPDALLKDAAALARRTNKSRSGLFTDALREYLVRHTQEEITALMNDALDEVDATNDPCLSTLAWRILERSKW